MRKPTLLVHQHGTGILRDTVLCLACAATLPLVSPEHRSFR
jgi:hypothetical protein